MFVAVSVQRRLEAAPVLRALPPPVLTRLASAAVGHALPRGAAAYREGEPAEYLYVVRSGTVKLSVMGSDGREAVSALVGPDEIFGEAPEGVRSHDARAVEPSRLFALPLAELRDEAAYASLLHARLARTTRTLHAMTLGNTHGRTAARLIELAEHQGRQVDEGTLIGVRVTQEDLARMIGSTRETANKVLADFDRRGWIRRHGRRLVITDAIALGELAGECGIRWLGSSRPAHHIPVAR